MTWQKDKHAGDYQETVTLRMDFPTIQVIERAVKAGQRTGLVGSKNVTLDRTSARRLYEALREVFDERAEHSTPG